MTFLAYNYKQKNGWTCGPAVVRVILHHFGQSKSIAGLARELRTTRGGTTNRHLLNFLKRNKLKFLVKENASVADIKRYLRRHLVVTAFWIPSHKESHYSIIKGVNSKRIYFHDPWFGSNHKYTLNHFVRNWWDEEARRWLLAISRRRARHKRPQS